MKYIAKIGAITIVAFLVSIIARAAIGPDTVMSEVEKRQTGFSTFKARLIISHTDKKGQKEKQYLNVYVKENPDYTQQRRFIFTSPDEVKGTSLLSYSRNNEDDKQWVYLPSFRKARSLSPRFQRKKYENTLLNFEDFNYQASNKYEYDSIQEKVIENKKYYILERRPNTRKSLYDKQVVYVEEKTYLQKKIEYYKKGNKYIKTLYYKNYVELEKGLWWPKKFELTNHNKEITVLEWNDIKIGGKIESKMFNSDYTGR